MPLEGSTKPGRARVVETTAELMILLAAYVGQPSTSLGMQAVLRGGRALETG
jgi:hypothetical protein